MLRQIDLLSARSARPVDVGKRPADNWSGMDRVTGYSPRRDLLSASPCCNSGNQQPACLHMGTYSFHQSRWGAEEPCEPVSGQAQQIPANPCGPISVSTDPLLKTDKLLASFSKINKTDRSGDLLASVV